MDLKPEFPLYLDVDLLAAVIRKVNVVAADGDRVPEVFVRAKVIAMLYERLLRSGGRPDQELVEKYLRLSN